MVIAFLIGGLVGVALMCILQINRLKDLEVKNFEYYEIYCHQSENTIIIEHKKEFKAIKGKKVDLLLKLIN